MSVYESLFSTLQCIERRVQTPRHQNNILIYYISIPGGVERSEIQH